MYGPIPEVSPGARSVNEAIAHARAAERRRIIGHPPVLTLTERIARAASRDMTGRRAS